MAATSDDTSTRTPAPVTIIIADKVGTLDIVLTYSVVLANSVEQQRVEHETNFETSRHQVMFIANNPLELLELT